ncbi:MAG: class I SAM-dependent methyltransferase [Rhodocyclaceae bacterium]|nr:class I SAM-dependent methyltransferase [Rhodocyclaceae bacterium]
MMNRIAAYTTPRTDVCALVPDTAQVVLDLGCSDGSLGVALKHHRPSRRVCGIEYSANLVNTAATRLDKVILGDLNQPDCLAQFTGETFDCIVAADVLEHLVAPENLLQYLSNFLAEDGSLVISMPNIRHHSALFSIYISGTFPRRERGIFDSTHLRWFTLKDARQLLQSAGIYVVAESYTLRVGDRGGGLINRAVQRYLGPFAPFAPLREFIAYQYVLRAKYSPIGHS